MNPWILVLHDSEEEDRHELRHGAAGGGVTRLARLCHLHAVNAELGGDVPQDSHLVPRGGMIEGDIVTRHSSESINLVTMIEQ